MRIPINCSLFFPIIMFFPVMICISALAFPELKEVDFCCEGKEHKSTWPTTPKDSTKETKFVQRIIKYLNR